MPADTSRPLYADMGSYLAARFPYKVQKISLHAGFSCPNRDGTKGRGGCTYCNNQTFSPDYCHTGRSITEQLDEGIAFFARKYPDMRYLAYFQAYTNTYGTTPHRRPATKRRWHTRGWWGSSSVRGPTACRPTCSTTFPTWPATVISWWSMASRAPTTRR